MKKNLLCFMIIACIFLNGCFDYQDINKVMFVTSIVIDIDKDKNPVLYVETFKPGKASSGGNAEEGQRIVYQGTGKTIFEALRDINLSSSFRLNYTQNKAIIFTTKAAEYGLNNLLDVFDRQQELLIRPYVCVYLGSPENLMKAKLKEEEYVGLFITELIDNQAAASRTVRLHLSELLNQRIIGSHTNVISIVDFKEDQPEQKLQVDGGAVFKDDKLVSIIKKQDGEKYNFLEDNVQSGTLEPINPQLKNKFATLEILGNKTKTSISYDGNTIHLKKTIKTNAAFAESGGRIKLNSETVKEVEAGAENNIRTMTQEFFDDYKKKGIDIFQVQEMFERKYPHEKIENPIEHTVLDVEVNVSIKDRMRRGDFRE